jgi:hypothetical protein
LSYQEGQIVEVIFRQLNGVRKQAKIVSWYEFEPNEGPLITVIHYTVKFPDGTQGIFKSEDIRPI